MVTLINTFTVPSEQEEAFLASWLGVAEGFAKASGFVSTRLHRQLGPCDTTRTFVNVAIWDSIEAYGVAKTAVLCGIEPLPGVTMHPGLFEVAVEMNAGG